MHVQQFVMAYGVEQDRLRALLPEGFRPLRPVLRINAEIRDGKTAWVEVSITINDQTETESLAVMDFRNKSIPIDTITSADAEKSIKRCLVKCAALHGLGLSLWTGEELSSAARKKKEDDLDDVKQEILSVVAGKLEAGVSKDTIYKAIESVAGVKNPNAIKDITTAQKVVEQIKKLEVKHNA